MNNPSLNVNSTRKVYHNNKSLIVRFSENHTELLMYYHLYKSTPNECQVQQKGTQEYNESVSIVAIYGIINLKALSYLIVVTKAGLVGEIMRREINRIEKVEFIPIGAQKINSSDRVFINDLKELFDTKTFYYSETYDLTNSIQRFIENKGIRKPIPQYCINYELIKQFRLCSPEQWIPLFISGLVAMKEFHQQNKNCTLILISRRDQRRMGRRFISRGSDLDGNCSNFAETEQIVKIENQYHSFLQTRGSMPFKWSQKPNLKWAPKGIITASDEQNLAIINKHFADQSKLGIQQQVLVNLIDKKGNQKLLGDYYQKMVDQMKNANVKSIWFDFHHECRAMKYENLSKLIDMLRSSLESGQQCSFEYGDNLQLISQQNTIIRTNCIDCLDRTNVVQSVIARHMLWTVLIKHNVIKPDQRTQEPLIPVELEQAFRDLWTLNADTISLLYTGTGALKTDSTKYGKRTKLGPIQDGYRSIKRYFLGNFYDGSIQNSIDLLTNKITLNKQAYNRPVINPMLFLIMIVIQDMNKFIAMPYGLYRTSNVLVEHPVVKQSLQLDPKDYLTPYKQIAFKLVLGVMVQFIVQKLIMNQYRLFVKPPKLSH